jgi:hypothetical protein
LNATQLYFILYAAIMRFRRRFARLIFCRLSMKLISWVTANFFWLLHVIWEFVVWFTVTTLLHDKVITKTNYTVRAEECRPAYAPVARPRLICIWPHFDGQRLYRLLEAFIRPI